MSSRLPFQDTSVFVSKSMTGVKDMLEKVGFSRTALINDEGNHAVAASYNGLNFQFEIYGDGVVQALIKHASDGKRWEISHKTATGDRYVEAFRDKADRIGWRALAAQIKVVCDSIKLGVMDVPDAFAGNLMIQTSEGSMTLGTHFKIKASARELNSPGFFQPLGLPAPEGVKDE